MSRCSKSFVSARVLPVQIVLEKLLDKDTKLEFNVQRWLRIDEDDGDVVREVAPYRPDGTQPQGEN